MSLKNRFGSTVAVTRVNITDHGEEEISPHIPGAGQGNGLEKGGSEKIRLEATRTAEHERDETVAPEPGQDYHLTDRSGRSHAGW